MGDQRKILESMFAEDNKTIAQVQLYNMFPYKLTLL